MELPLELSMDARTRIHKAEITAGIELSSQRNEFGLLETKDVIDYVMAVVFAFGRESCQKAKGDIILPPPSFATRWDLTTVQQETRRFLESFVIEGFLEKSHEDIRSENGTPLTDILDSCLHSPEWMEFQGLLIELADVQVNRPRIIPPPPPPMPLTPPPADRRNPTAKAIEASRLKARLSQDQLAGLMKIAPSSVYRHESGKSIPPGWRVDQYSRVFSDTLKEKIVIPETPRRRK
jgi:hypothetical protein